MKHRLYKEQQLHCDIETAWNFFSSPKNLSKITPNDMRFTVRSDYNSEQIVEGMIIDYTVSPLLKVPLNWRRSEERRVGKECRSWQAEFQHEERRRKRR